MCSSHPARWKTHTSTNGQRCGEQLTELVSCTRKRSEFTLTFTVLKEPNGKKYYLTGISLDDEPGGSGPHIPRDPHLARIGGATLTSKRDRTYNSSFVRYFSARIGRPPPWLKGLQEKYSFVQAGFSVHAHCWMLLNQSFDGGTTYIEANLDRFIRAARKYWRGNKFLWGLDNWAWQMYGWEECQERAVMEFYHGCDVYQNPLVDPKVRKIIDQARPAKSNRPCSQFIRLPLDVVTLIAEQVCPVSYTAADVENMRNMLAAFQWVLPECFWNARCRRDVIFELNDMKKTNSHVDWEALRLDLMSLLADEQSALYNRARIMGIICSIKSNFFSKGKGK